MVDGRRSRPYLVAIEGAWPDAADAGVQVPADVEARLVPVGGHAFQRRERGEIDQRPAGHTVVEGALRARAARLPVVVQPAVVEAEVKQTGPDAIDLARPVDHLVHDRLHLGLRHLIVVSVPRSPAHRGSLGQSVFLAVPAQYPPEQRCKLHQLHKVSHFFLCASLQGWGGGTNKHNASLYTTQH
jgi:hypothetical protein